ncbi:unnamed protein product, partial [Didymodactylos carnosus]
SYSKDVVYLKHAIYVNTNTAVAFLRSPLGERLKYQDAFRIVTDMNRLNENPSDNAGARLIKAVRELGFNNHCLIFTGDYEHSERQVKKLVSV